MSPTATLAPATASAHGRTAEAVERLLASVDVRVRHQIRLTAHGDEIVPVPAGGVTMVYVIAGDVRVRDEAAPRREIPAGDAASPSPEAFGPGDVLLSNGRHAISVDAASGSTVLLSTLDLAGVATPVVDRLPALAIVRGFAALEPAAAALAEHLGVDREARAVPERAGDGVICRTMARTVLLSVIRAWSAGACAPSGWPSVSDDPYLDRVVEAIHADPGRDWTVEGLASLGAMSRSVFAERFRAALDRSPLGYVVEVRMRAAQDLLRRGLGVSTVSRELGYASDEGFSRAFRRHVGMTPSTWRATHGCGAIAPAPPAEFVGSMYFCRARSRHQDRPS